MARSVHQLLNRLPLGLQVKPLLYGEHSQRALHDVSSIHGAHVWCHYGAAPLAPNLMPPCCARPRHGGDSPVEAPRRSVPCSTMAPPWPICGEATAPHPHPRPRIAGDTDSPMPASPWRIACGLCAGRGAIGRCLSGGRSPAMIGRPNPLPLGALAVLDRKSILPRARKSIVPAGVCWRHARRGASASCSASAPASDSPCAGIA